MPNWTKEEARENARKGGLARQAKAREARQAPQDDEEGRERLLQRLWEASSGQGEWSDLKPSERLDALKRYLEYRLGKPSARVGQELETPGELEERGITLE